MGGHDGRQRYGRPVELDRVVAARQGPRDGADLLPGEAVGVALVGVDHDLELDDARSPGGGHPYVGPGLAPALHSAIIFE